MSDKVYYTGTGKTFENGDWLEHGKQGEVMGPVTCEELKGKGVAVLFAGNKRMDYCCLTQARRLPPPTAPRCPSRPSFQSSQHYSACGRTGKPRAASTAAAGRLRGERQGLLHGDR